MDNGCPCKGCTPPKRSPACHSTCPSYASWKSEHEQVKANIREAKRKDEMFIYFAETTKDMTAVEILNYYRNLYYADPQVTERGIVANAINDYFEQTKHMTEWISVEERLPDCCGMSVLMVAVNQYSQTRVVKGFTDYQCPITFHTNEREYDGIWSAWDVTHWMPLPNPPKMKGGEGK